MTILEEYKPLFFDDYFVCDLWGGRGGGRSYHLTAHALYELLYNPNLRGFFVRQISSTIYGSMWQDLKDRMQEYQDQGGDLSHIKMTDSVKGDNYIENTITGATIKTASFQTGSGNTTAKLKSLAGATNLWIDELEEVDENEYLKLEESFRKKGVKIKIVRAFNPPQRLHWIWKEYSLTPVKEEELINHIVKVSKEPLEDVKNLVTKNRLVKGNNLDGVYSKAEAKGYRHISIFANYHNNRANLDETAKIKYERRKYTDLDYYIRQYLGYISAGAKGVIFKSWQELDKAPEHLPFMYGVDWGYNDPFAVVQVWFDWKRKELYCKEIIYLTQLKPQDMIEVAEARTDKTKQFVCDHSPSLRLAFEDAGFNIWNAKKEKVEDGVKNLLDWKLFVHKDSHNLKEELYNYKYSDKDVERPIDAYNHCIDAIRYVEREIRWEKVG